jgi:hypothetical protein
LINFIRRKKVLALGFVKDISCFILKLCNQRSPGGYMQLLGQSDYQELVYQEGGWAL